MAHDLYGRMFRRHAHPVSAWTRLLTAPLLVVPLWTRRWWLYLPIAAWFALNPVVTPPARDTSAFATRAILAEESWSRDPTSEPRILAVTAVSSATLLGAMVAAYRRRAAPMVVACAAFVGLTLVQWRLFADRFDRLFGPIPGASGK